MNLTAFQIAGLFCRALSFWLWWSAGLSVLGAFAGVFGFGLWGSASQSGLSILGFFGAALMLGLFNSGLSAAMTGRGAFDEETIRTAPKPTGEERALVQACGGLLLLIHGALEFTSWIVLLFSGFGGSANFGVIGFLAAPTLKVGLGLFFAFRLGLKRLLPR